MTRFLRWLFDYDPKSFRGFLWELVLIVPDSVCAVAFALAAGITLVPLGFVLRLFGVAPETLAWVIGIPSGLAMVWYLGFPRRRPQLWWLGNTKRWGDE